MIQDAAKRLAPPVEFRARYDNFIGGEFRPPAGGRYFENPSPVTGQTFCEVARSTAEDVEAALDAAHKAKDAWGRTSPTEPAFLQLRDIPPAETVVLVRRP